MKEISEELQMTEVTTFLGLSFTAAGLFFTGEQARRAIKQYKYEQRWRRKEYAAKEYEKLILDAKASLALKMLDWDYRKWPLKTDSHGWQVLSSVCRNRLGRSLIPHDIKGRPRWYGDDAIIRDCFDTLLDKIVTFEIMLENKLIDSSDIKPYLGYWVKLISAGKNRSRPEAIRNLHLYIERYDYEKVVVFCERFGFDIKPSETDRADLLAEGKEKKIKE
jgi:hypothetical protein